MEIKYFLAFNFFIIFIFLLLFIYFIYAKHFIYYMFTFDFTSKQIYDILSGLLNWIILLFLTRMYM